LFNAFNTIAVLMHKDVNLAHQISLEQRLDPAQFTRIARSSIVNINSVLELQNMFNGDFVAVLKNGDKVNGSRRYREALDALLN
jgi:two-component system LytT family response regulator